MARIDEQEVYLLIFTSFFIALRSEITSFFNMLQEREYAKH